MTAIPQLDVPEILVDNEEERANRAAATDGGAAALGPRHGEFLSAEDGHTHHRSWSGVSADISSYDTSYDHPLASPRADGPGSPGHRNQPSAFSFEVHEPADEPADNGSQATRNDHRGSSVSPAQVREMLDDSVWMASIRRSATMRRNNQGGGQSL